MVLYTLTQRYSDSATLQTEASARLEKKLIEAMGNRTHRYRQDIDRTTVQDIDSATFQDAPHRHKLDKCHFDVHCAGTDTDNRRQDNTSNIPAI